MSDSIPDKPSQAEGDIGDDDITAGSSDDEGSSIPAPDQDAHPSQAEGDVGDDDITAGEQSG